MPDRRCTWTGRAEAAQLCTVAPVAAGSLRGWPFPIGDSRGRIDGRIAASAVLGRRLLVGAQADGPPVPLSASLRIGYPAGMDSPIREVDPAELRLPPSRASGADPWKLHQQARRFGRSRDGMPAILVYEDPDGVLEITDGVTRATRMARFAPGEPVSVVIVGKYRRSRGNSPRVGDRL